MKRFAAYFLCLSVFLIVFFGCQKNNEKSGSVNDNSNQSSGSKFVSITTDPFINLGKSIKIRFSLPMVDFSDIGTDKIDTDRLSLSFSPELPGDYKWESQAVLEFTPKPGLLKWGQYVSLLIPKAIPFNNEAAALRDNWSRNLQVSYFQVAGKVASWPILPGYPRFIQALTSFTNEVGQGPLLLLYDQAITADKISPYITVTWNGKKLNFNVAKPKKLDYILDDSTIPEEIIGLVISGLPDNGETITIEVPEWYYEEENGKESERRSSVTMNLTVNKRFFVSDITRPGTRQDIFPLDSKISLQFNNKYIYSMINNKLACAPKPESFYFYQDWNGSVVIDARFAPGTDYEITFSGPVIDVLGNKLEPFKLRFRSQDLAPVLEAPQYPIVLEKGKTNFPVKVRNMGKMEARVYTFEEPESFARALGYPEARSVDEYGLTGPYKTFKINTAGLVMNSFSTIDALIDSAPGLKCVEIRGDGTGSEADGSVSDVVLVQTTNIGITSKVFPEKVLVLTTTLDKAIPLAKSEIECFDSNGSRLGAGTSDASGIAILKDILQAKATGVSNPLIIIARNGIETAVSRLLNEELSSAWQFNLPGTVEGTGVLRAALFTDRGIYRPGEKVHVKTIASLLENRPNERIELIVSDPRGKEIVRSGLNLDGFGAANYDLDLAKEAAVGEYIVQVSKNAFKSVHTFSVEEYRVPTFIVSLSSGDEKWSPGDTKTILINAEYLHGEKLSGRAVKWNVFRQFETFTAPSFPGYQFAIETHPELNGFVAKDETKLNGQGQLPVTFTVNPPEVPGPERYIVGASVTDIDRQTFAGRLSRIVHSSDFYIGVLPPQKAVLRQGEKIEAPVIALQTDGSTIADIKVKAILERIDYHTTGQLSASGAVELFNRMVPEKVEEKSITSKKVPVNCSFELKAAGYYRIRLTAQDKKNRNVETGFIVTVSGDNATAWPRFDKDQIELVFDKTSYQPGETAKIVVQTPYDKATGFLTVERDDILTYRSFEINKNTPAISLPIDAKYAPNVFVSIVLLRGRIHDKKDATGFETGAPGFKIGYKKLRVELKEQKLTVKAIPKQKYVSPGDNVSIDISLADFAGRPVPGQVTLIVVDEAVLGLTNYRTPDPLYSIYADYPLGVRTGTLYLDLPNSRHERHEQMFPAGGGGTDSDMALAFPLSLRKLFESTAFWDPDISIGATGKKEVTVKLPDNITTYRIMAVASDTSSRAGSGEDKIVSRKPLMVQPALPRFVYPDDEFEAEALVFNSSGTSGTINFMAVFEGLSIVSGQDKQSKKASPGESPSFKLKVKVTSRNKIVVRFSAKLNDVADAAEFTIPVLEPGTKRVVVENRLVLKTGSVSLDIPKDRIPGTSGAEIVVSSTALSELKDSVQYLMHYPNGCIEQTTSTAYPLVVLSDLLPDIGVEVDRAALKEFAEAGVKRILSFQTQSGGLSYWPGGTQPHAFATSFGLTALIEAKHKGYDVPDKALSDMANFLEATLRKDEIREEMPHASMADGDTRALIVMTLGRLGRPQASYVSTLWRERKKITAFGLSFLAIAVKEMNGDKAFLHEILAEIRRIADENKDEAFFSGKPKGGWSLDSPLRTHGASLIACAEEGDDDELASKFLKGLLSRQRNGSWGNTQEDVFGIMGVHTAVSKKLGGDVPSIVLYVNGKKYTTDNLVRISKNVYKLSLTDSELKAERIDCSLTNNLAAQVYLTVRMNYDVPFVKQNMEGKSNGFAVSRTYKTLDGKPVDTSSIELGGLVRVHLLVKTNSNLHYCVVDDKLPAGLEPVNMNLATTESIEQGQLTEKIQRGLSVLSYHEIRDHRVAFYTDELLANEYEFTYLARATTPGKFLRPSARGEAMYQPDINGTTDIDYVTVK
jgi:uncharacterized protein YfaS (alpha-2-macroglobulin family)